jgi:hypothetical protein
MGIDCVTPMAARQKTRLAAGFHELRSPSPTQTRLRQLDQQR